jgi:hypothetical protein
LERRSAAAQLTVVYSAREVLCDAGERRCHGTPGALILLSHCRLFLRVLRKDG